MVDSFCEVFMPSNFSNSVFAMDDMQGMLAFPIDWAMPALDANDLQRKQSLAEMYPMCLKISGQPFFDYLATEYIMSYPSSSGVEGESFPDLLAMLLTGRANFLAELASFEWAYAHAAQHSFLLSTHFPVHQIWQMFQDEHSPQELHDFKMMLPHHRFYFLIWVEEGDVMVDVLNKDEWQILKWMRQRLSFTEIRENIDQLNSGIDIEYLLPYMSAKGWLAVA